MEFLKCFQTICLNDKDVNYVNFLHEISQEHQFEVTYVDIEEKTYTGRVQCLVQLSTLPVAVCQGKGAFYLVKVLNSYRIVFYFRIWKNIKRCTDKCCQKCFGVLKNYDQEVRRASTSKKHCIDGELIGKKNGN